MLTIEMLAKVKQMEMDQELERIRLNKTVLPKRRMKLPQLHFQRRKDQNYNPCNCAC